MLIDSLSPSPLLPGKVEALIDIAHMPYFASRPEPVARPAVLASGGVVTNSGHAQQVIAAQGGDMAAMRKLLEGLAPIVLATTRQILGQREDAEDAAQESLFDLARKLDTLREPKAVVAFARRLTARVALRHRKKRALDGERVKELARQRVEPAHIQPSLGVARQQTERLREHLTRLPEAQAVAVIMQHMLGYKPSEIAEVTGVPVNTVRSRVRFGRLALAKSLAADGAFDTPATQGRTQQSEAS